VSSCLLSDVMAGLSDVDISSERSVKPDMAGFGHQDADCVRSQPTDDDDDDDDDNAFTHSSALTIKSIHHSPDSSLTSVNGSSRGRVSQSSVALSCAEQLRHADCSDVEPSVTSHNIDDNSSHFNPAYVMQSRQCTTTSDISRTTCATNADPDLRSFLSELGLGKYADIFCEQDVDLPMFLTLSEDDLKEIGIRLQPL